MVLNKNDADLSIPKILLNFMFEKVAFTLEENQFGEIMGAVDSFALFHRGIKVAQHTCTVLHSFKCFFICVVSLDAPNSPCHQRCAGVVAVCW